MKEMIEKFFDTSKGFYSNGSYFPSKKEIEDRLGKDYFKPQTEDTQ
jgi:hypothetical protein